jgi:antitoxin ParD1/3/4
MNTMNVSLGGSLKEYVEQKVATGRYTSASEVIREALRLMQQQDAEREAKIAWLREAIQQGLDSPVREWEGADEIIRLAKEREAGR